MESNVDRFLREVKEGKVKWDDEVVNLAYMSPVSLLEAFNYWLNELHSGQVVWD